MMRSERLVTASILSALLVLLSGGSVAGQEHEPAPESPVADHHSPDKEFHRNHFGGLIGVSTHSDTDEMAATMGLEYARQFSPWWALSVYTELVSSSLERDIIVVAGGIFYPVRRLGLLVGAGVESVAREVEHNGKIETEDETGFLVRIGAGYGFRVTPQASLGPIVLVDKAGDRWTVVYSLAMVVGF